MPVARADAFDREGVQRIDIDVLEAFGHAVEATLLLTPHPFEHREPRRAEAAFGQPVGDLAGRRAIGGKGDDPPSGRDMLRERRHAAFHRRAAVQRDACRPLDGPAEPCGGEGEGRWRRSDVKCVDAEPVGERSADPEMHRIARGQHGDPIVPRMTLDQLIHARREWRRPSDDLGAVDCVEPVKKPFWSKDDVGVPHRLRRARIERTAGIRSLHDDTLAT